MKRFIIILICMLSVSYHAYSHDYYYWYRGKQIPLRQGSQFYMIYDAKESRGVDSLQVIEGGYLSFSKEAQLKWGIVSEQTIANVKNVLYKMPSFVCSDTTQNMYVTHRFYVKLRRQDDIILLNNLVEQYQIEIEQEGDFPLWYIIRCGLNSQQNALSLANIFYESGLFAVAEPEFMNAIRLDCVNDPMFSQQWNLKNTNYSGIDINYCDVHAITSGNASSIIGVYDIGVELTHPDINLYSFSYDVNTQSSPSTIYTTANGNNYHGTACAGIIGAKTDNSIGVAGIAPDCPIMSISFHNTTTQKIGNGFKVAANQGCSVISNSWSLSAPSTYVNEGISYALSHGRDGKGCVIVFSAGNENRDSINYPANSNDSIIVVGAMSPCGERCNPNSCDGYNWGSNYGSKLDIMAPGVLIRTTDLVGTAGHHSSDYITDFMGTSAACPHVAAVAGLILSVNPYLTQKEVADIIESTAQKLNWFTNNTPYYNYPNGTWCEYVGYGLVDAYAAVITATEDYYPIQGPDYVCDTAKYYLIHPSGTGETVKWSIYNNGMGAFPSFSILGSDNQDTVIVLCTNPTPMSREEIDRGMGKGLSVKIKQGADSVIYQKEFRLPQGDIPTILPSSTGIWNGGASRTFTITNCTGVPDSLLTWSVKKSVAPVFGATPTITITTYSGRSITYNPMAPGGCYCTVDVTATNTQKECEERSSTLHYVIKTKKSINAQQNGNVLEIIISEEEQANENGTYTLELWNSIYGCMRTQSAVNTHEQMNIQNLPQGVYVLLLKENGNTIAETKVIIN